MEIKTEAEWDELLERFSKETGMAASLRDATGNILRSAGEYYRICSEIRAREAALQTICMQTNSAMLREIETTLAPVADLCEGGMLRIVVPIVRGGGLAGYVAACGLRSIEQEPEYFLISKTLEIGEEEAARRAEETPKVDPESLLNSVDRLFVELNPR